MLALAEALNPSLSKAIQVGNRHQLELCIIVQILTMFEVLGSLLTAFRCEALDHFDDISVSSSKAWAHCKRGLFEQFKATLVV